MSTEATSERAHRLSPPPAAFRRGAAILPSLFTTGNLFLGFWAMVRTLHGQYAEAAPLIFWAILLDLLDGRIARMTGTTSEFGAELDSLADVVSFGVAPALLAYSWGFAHPAARGLAGRVPVRRLRRAAPGALQRAEERRWTAATSSACPSRPRRRRWPPG